ncbi:MAG: alanine racemase [Chloroflexota bacterium]
MARAGIVLYGVSPDAGLPLPDGVRPVMRLRTRIARVFRLEPGESVGYNRTWRAERPERAALVPVGYADGYRRSFSSRAWMASAGTRMGVIGRVSMDQTVLLAPDGADVAQGDEVTVFGDGSDGAPTIGDLATLADTNTYEILVGIGARVPRVVLRGGEIAGSEDRLGRPGA